MIHLAALTVLCMPAPAAPAVAPSPVVARVFLEEEEDFSGSSIADLEAKIKSERDDVSPGVIKALAEMETRESMEALLRAHDTFGSIYMRREVLLGLVHFDAIEDAFQPALEKLMNEAVGGTAREIRVAALETLGRCPEHGQTFLAQIVDSPAEDAIRERALDLHVRIGGDGHDTWYRKVYERTVQAAQKEARGGDSKKKKKKKRKKKGAEEEPEVKKQISWPTAQLRGTAMEAIIESMKDDELTKAFEDDRSMTIKRTALAELAKRNHKKAPEYATVIIERVDFRGTDRALAAEILLKDQGADVADALIKIALKSVTPEVLRQRIAEILSDLNDEDVNKKLSKLVGKGKGPQKAFALRATMKIDNEKLLPKIRKGLKDKDPLIVSAAVEALAARGDRGSIKDMEKVLGKTKDQDILAKVMVGLSTIYDGENEWVERLVEYAGAESVDIRNAALVEIARLGRRNTIDLFKERLAHPSWSTRLIALKALEEQRNADLLEPIITQMQTETGRMQLEFGNALFRLTGEPFGKRASSWKRWLDDAGGDITILDDDALERAISEEEERRLKQVSTAAFFGIRIESHRVMFIIDVSGSMNEPVRAEYVGETGRPRIDVAKEELRRALEALDEKALFNIAPFSGDVEGWLEDGIASADDVSREDALVYVDRLGAGGGTNLYGSLVFTFDDPDIDTIFLLSDGEPSVGDLTDPQMIRDAIAELNETRNVVINTIAIGSSLQVLEWLAEDSGGTHVEIQ